jgi:hypothetical protein
MRKGDMSRRRRFARLFGFGPGFAGNERKTQPHL